MNEKEREKIKKRAEVLKENGEENIDKITDMLFRNIMNRKTLRKKLKK